MDKSNKLKTGLIKFLTIVGDLMALNALWFVCSLPIITVGPSTNALFSVTLKLAEESSFPVLKTFFKAFKENFKQSLVVGAFSILAILLLYADIGYVFAVEGPLQKVYIVVSILLYAVLLTTISYLNALIARYNNSLKGHIINTFKLAFVNPVQTIIIWLTLSIPVLIVLFVQPIVIIYLGWLFIFFLVSLPVYICSTVLMNIFKKFDNERG